MNRLQTLTQTNKIKALKNFIPLVLLVMYGIFLMTFHPSGSLGNDEAIYSQVAREMLHRNTLIEMTWQEHAWFEKPPVMIWLTMLSFKLFGVSDVSAHFFPGLFGIAGIILAYVWGKELFQKKLAGFLSGLILATTPMYVWLMRSNMMDVPIGVCIALSLFGYWKFRSTNNNRWWFLFGGAIGLGVMIKSVIGLFPIPIILLFSMYKKDFSSLRERTFWYGTALSLLLILPWHIIMSFWFGHQFWNDYLGYHVLDRFMQPILNTPWDNNTWYFAVTILQRSGVWIFCTIFIVLNRSFKTYRDETVFLGIWAMLIFVVFTLGQTKLPHYIAPIFFPLGMFTGGMIAQYYSRHTRFLLALFCISLLSFTAQNMLLVSDFGESFILIPKVVSWIKMDPHWFMVPLFCLCLIALGIIGAKHYRFLVWYRRPILVFSIVALHILIPFNPNRNPFIAHLGNTIQSYRKEGPMVIYKNPAIRPIHAEIASILPFYAPIGSVIQKVDLHDMSFIKRSDVMKSSVCFFDAYHQNGAMQQHALIRYPEGTLSACRLSHPSSSIATKQ